jgi:hypothetical protein
MRTANAAFLHANTAYAAGNTTWTYAANDIQRIANAAFLHANTAYAAGNTTWTYAANDVMRTANAAFLHANTAYAAGNTTWTYAANNVMLAANASFAMANAANLMPVGNTMSNSYYTVRATRRQINFVPGTNITINVDDDPTLNTANITITSTATGEGASVAVSDASPPDPTANSLWWNSTLGKMFIYYADGTSNQWVESSPGLVSANGVGTESSGPQDNTIANLAFDKANTGTSGGIAFDTANSAFDKANSANIISDSAFGYANGVNSNTFTALATSVAAFGSGNTTWTYAANDVMLAANSAYAKANAANIIADSAFEYANGVNTNTFTSLATSVAAFVAGNTIWTYAANDVMRTANAAFLHANTAYAAGNTTWTYAANDVQRIANAAFLHANTAYAAGNTTWTYAANDVMRTANASFAAGNTTWTYAANDVMRTANSAYAKANLANVLANTCTITYVIDGGGTVLTTGEKGSIYVPYTANVIQWTLFADQSGTANIDMWTMPYSETIFPSVANSFTGNLGMTLSTARANQSIAFSNWRMGRINAGNVLTFNIQSTATITRLMVSLKCVKE